MTQDEQEQEYINNFFSEFEENTSTINQNLEKSAKLEHEMGLGCWCYKDKGYWLQPLRIDGFIHGCVWSKGRSIFCWLCMLDEYDVGAPFHHVCRTIYTDEDFLHHIAYEHLHKERSEYLSRLPPTKEYGWITIKNE